MRAAGTSGPREAGVATVVLPMLLWLGTIAAIAVIDLGAYLTAAARAQALADAAALAAVSAEVEGARAVSPIREADRTVVAGGGQLEGCVCDPGSARAAVRVSVAVPGLVLPTLGAARVSADAAATLVSPP